MIKSKILKTESLRTMLSLIKYPLITDKTTRLLQANKYSFIIDKRANKFTVKKVIEYIFNVNVTNVNTLTNPLKKKQLVVFLAINQIIKKQ